VLSLDLLVMEYKESKSSAPKKFPLANPEDVTPPDMSKRKSVGLFKAR
jgi:hypothetical protein